MEQSSGTGPRAAERERASLRVLIADDDPTSLRFIAQALQQLGTQATACDDGRHALRQAREQPYDLLLLDRRMPGGGATQILAALRTDATAASRDAMAVATSAEFSSADRAALVTEGFLGVLEKPCDLATLRTLLQQVRSDEPGEPLLDDDAAMVCSGDTTIMQALRGLLHGELENFEDGFALLLAEPEQLIERLHRLRSSCGFCGAAALAVQAASLQQQLALQPVPSAQVLARFQRVLARTRHALSPRA